MRKRALACLPAAGLVAACVAAHAGPERGDCSLFVQLPQARQLDIVAAQLPWFEGYASRLIVTVADGGHTVFPTRSQVFAWTGNEGEEDVLAGLIQAAHEAGVRVYGHLDLWHWVQAEEVSEHDLFSRRPELFAVDAKGECAGSQSLGRYAEPLHPECQAAIVDVAKEVVARYPALDGLLLEFRLPLQVSLTRNARACAAYAEATGVDPTTIDPRADGGEEGERAAQWHRWRLEQAAECFAGIRGAIRETRPDCAVAALVYGRAYAWPLYRRAQVTQDWLAWVESGAVDELVFQDGWQRAGGASVFAEARGRLADAAPDLPVGAVLDAFQRTPTLAEQYDGVKAAAGRPHVVLYAHSLSHTPKAYRYLLLESRKATRGGEPE